MIAHRLAVAAQLPMVLYILEGGCFGFSAAGLAELLRGHQLPLLDAGINLRSYVETGQSHFQLSIPVHPHQHCLPEVQQCFFREWRAAVLFGFVESVGDFEGEAHGHFDFPEHVRPSGGTLVFVDGEDGAAVAEDGGFLLDKFGQCPCAKELGAGEGVIRAVTEETLLAGMGVEVEVELEG